MAGETSVKRVTIAFNENCPKCGKIVTHQNTKFYLIDNQMKYHHECGQIFNENLAGNLIAIN